MTAMTGESQSKCAHGNASSHAPDTHPASAPATVAAMAPSTVFPGLIEGYNFLRPTATPAK